MYESFYGLKENAFSLTPDSSFLFLNARCKEALDQILGCIERREGVSVIAGDIGTGKTTLCWALLEKLAKKNIRTAVIQNPRLSELEILRTILQDLGVRPESAAREAEAQNVPQQLFDGNWMNGLSKNQLLDLLNGFLVDRAQEGSFTVLIVDEAQNLPLMLLEQLRLLSNLKNSRKKLLQIIFVGQLQLMHKLKSSSLRQLNQQVSFRFETKPLSPGDTEQYIRHRLNIAGSPNGAQFSDGAFRAIWRYSKGYPRLINLVCDRALLAGCNEQTSVITPRLVRRAVMDLRGVDAKSTRPFALEWFRKAAPLKLALSRVLEFFKSHFSLQNASYRQFASLISEIKMRLSDAARPKAKVRTRRFFQTLFPAAAILMLGITGLFGFIVYKVSYPEPAMEVVNPSHYLLPYVAVGIPCGKDSDIPAWWIPGLKSAPGIVLAPGYGMSRSDALSLAAQLNQYGFNLLIYAQRGNGSMPKSANALGLRESEDMVSVLQFLKQRAESDPERIGIWGVDVGAFAALKAAATFPEVRAIAADSPYETVQSYLDYRITEDFGLENGLILFGCRQVFRLVHLFAQASLNEALPLNDLSGKAIVVINGEDHPGLADLATAIDKKIQPQTEMISFRTARIHAMSGEILKAYDMQAADFFLINLK